MTRDKDVTLDTLFRGLDDFEVDEDYEPDDEEKAQFKEFFCERCGKPLEDETDAPDDSYVCYDCLASDDGQDDGSFCAGCGCLLTDDNADPTSNVCYHCE